MQLGKRIKYEILKKEVLTAIETETQIPKNEIAEKMVNIQKKFGVSFLEFYKENLWEYSEDEIKKEYNNADIKAVAEILNISYMEAKSKMGKIKREYGINYREYAENKLYVYKTKKKLEEKIEQIDLKKKSYIENVCKDTGWSYEKALREAERVRKKYGINYKKYAAYRFFAMSEEEICEKLKGWNEKQQDYENIVMQESGWDKKKVQAHMKKFQYQFNIPPAYYVLYRAWELSDEQMDSYARQKLSEKIWAKYNDKEEAKILAEKDKFDQVYKDYIQRKFWLNTNKNYAEFLEFIEGLDYVFCKPIMFGGGLGTEKYKINHENPEELYELLINKDRLLVEECVNQHKEIDEFISGCVNTIRVVTIKDKNEVKIICTGIRFGYQGITDNFSKDGMVADVDPETGIIRTPAVDKKGHIFEQHPISGKKFVGFQIPLWDEVIKVAKAAIQVQEGVNYVGWDLAVCENKVVIIEGNSMPDLVLVQAPYAKDKIGKRYLFDPYL